MKLSKKLAVGVIIILFINRFSDNTKQYNTIIYGLFISLLGYKLISNLYQFYKIKRSEIYKGKIIYYLKEDNIGNENQNYIIDVSFISPHDNKEYIIKSKVNSLPKNEYVDVIFNEKDPKNSKIYNQSSTLENLSLLIAICAFLYFLLTNTFSR